MQDQPSTPYGYCKCGCGEKTNIAPNSSTRSGWVKGEPINYVAGHGRRGRRFAPLPPAYKGDGLCECGCGGKTTIRNVTQLTLGYRAGDPARFLHGHGSRITGKRHTEEDRGHETPCWIWQGALTKGYGVIQRRGRGASPQVVHRLNWEAIHGPVPEGLELDHLCNVHACVNPDHLEPVTHAENMRRWMRRDGRCA